MAKRYSNLVDMMREVTDDNAFADGLAEHLARRRLVSGLVALRVARGMTQQQLAAKLNCSQARISKIEASSDGDIDLGTLVGYVDAMGFQVEITLLSKEITLVERVKHHAFKIKRLTDRLAGIGSKDPKIADGVGDFLKEAAFNLVRLVQSSAKHLASPPIEPQNPLAIDVYGPEQVACEREEGLTPV